jgi:hypothetical protein
MGRRRLRMMREREKIERERGEGEGLDIGRKYRFFFDKYIYLKYLPNYLSI